MSEITVLLPLYSECDEYIMESVNSILQQTYQDFRLLIRLDNPDNIRIQELIEEFKAKDSRIDFAINERNYGLPETLNQMINEVDTPFIARMDGDDISSTNRLEIQYNFMKKNPEVDLCGTNIIYIDGEGVETHRKGNLPTQKEDIVKTLRYIDVFCHPTFFAKTAVMKKLKYRNLQYSQDYDLVCRMVEQGYVLTNINQYLLCYRSGENSDAKVLKQRIISGEIQKYYSNGNLNEINLIDIIENDFKKINDKKIKKYGKSTRNYRIGIIAMKKKKIFKACIKISESFFQSKYMRGNIFKAFVFRFIILKG